MNVAVMKYRPVSHPERGVDRNVPGKRRLDAADHAREVLKAGAHEEDLADKSLGKEQVVASLERPWLRFHGHMPADDLTAICKHSTALLSPSPYGTASPSVLEGLAHVLCVVGSAVGALAPSDCASRTLIDRKVGHTAQSHAFPISGALVKTGAPA